MRRYHLREANAGMQNAQTGANATTPFMELTSLFSDNFDRYTTSPNPRPAIATEAISRRKVNRNRSRGRRNMRIASWRAR